jgi:hypothetical protein
MSRSVSSMAGLTLATICFVVSSFWALPTAKADDKDDGTKSQPASFWMKKKLDYSQNILAGIANADFDKIAESAQSMQSLSKVEGFIRGQMPGYRTQLEAFLDANAEIIRQAQKDNVEGAALAFTQLTISCVNCHKRLREAK